MCIRDRGDKADSSRKLGRSCLRPVATGPGTCTETDGEGLGESCRSWGRCVTGSGGLICGDVTLVLVDSAVSKEASELLGVSDTADTLT